MVPEVLKRFALFARTRISPVEPKKPGKEWWQRPGLGIQYQIEFRPGWAWNRDFREFNRSMMDERGRLNFNGPFCKIEDWVRLSKDVGVDWHQMEIKWHDGICYFDTKLTDWKTETDYAGQFAGASRAAGIPFMYYYSSIFDHNPQFDRIQPSQNTISFIGMPPNTVYDEYIRGQYREIIEKYRPDGMWIDWYWPDQATRTTVDFFRANYPEVVLSFNFANWFPKSYEELNFTSGEAHDIGGPYLKILREETGILTVFSSTWKWAKLERRARTTPWEFITPAGKWWQDPSLRDDPNDLVRMAAITMACGGKLCIGVTSLMDGSLHPDQVKQLKIIGEWYGPRRALFGESAPLRYSGQEPAGVEVHPESVRAIACRWREDTLLHLVNIDGATRPMKIRLRGKPWDMAGQVCLEPGGREVEVDRSGGAAEMLIRPENIDPVDTILRLEKKR
jgi:alpha-L-fucosidase